MENYDCRVAGEEDKYFAVSQFEPTHARRCFPCWDEPVIKAEFEVTLSIDANKTALSNMVIILSTFEHIIIQVPIIRACDFLKYVSL